MSYDINPIEDFSPLRHQGKVAEALGEVVPDLLASLKSVTNPYRLDAGTVGGVTTYSVVIDTEDLSDNTVTQHTLEHTTAGTETFDEVIQGIVVAFNLLDTPLHTEGFTEYTEDEDKYITVVPEEGYRIVNPPPVATGLDLDLTVQVQGYNGKPASLTAHQLVMEQDYPKLIVTGLPIVTVNENWKTGSVEKTAGGDTRFYPYNDQYIRASFQVTCECGSVTDVLTSDRPDSGQILRKIVARLSEDNARIAFYNKVQGTLSRDFTIIPVPAMNFTEYEDSSIMNFDLDIITREIVYSGDIMTKTEVQGAELKDRQDGQVQPIDFEVEAPSHNP